MSEHPKNQPRQPTDGTPDAGTSPAINPDGKTPNGIPHGDDASEPMGLPNSDRQQGETLPVRT